MWTCNTMFIVCLIVGYAETNTTVCEVCYNVHVVSGHASVCVSCVLRRIEQLESSNDSEVATLPLSQSHGIGTRSISHGSLDGTNSMATLHAPPPHL